MIHQTCAMLLMGRVDDGSWCRAAVGRFWGVAAGLLLDQKITEDRQCSSWDKEQGGVMHVRESGLRVPVEASLQYPQDSAL